MEQNKPKRREDDILRDLAWYQQAQEKNPPTSKAWQEASREIHRLAEELTGKKPKDACGR